MNNISSFFVVVLLSSSLLAMEEQANTSSVERGADVLFALWNARQAQDRQEDMANSTAVSPVIIEPHNDNALEPLPLDEVLKNLGKYHCDKCAVTFENPALAVAHNLATKHVTGFRYFQHTQAQALESGSNNNSSKASVSRLVTENLSPRLNTQFINRSKPFSCECHMSFETRSQMLIHMGTNDHRHGFVKK